MGTRNRETTRESYRFGNASYAREELRADLACVFLMAERGIPHDPERHASYLILAQLVALREDKHEMFRAARDASDFLVSSFGDGKVPRLGIGSSGKAREESQSITESEPRLLVRCSMSWARSRDPWKWSLEGRMRQWD